MTRATPIFLDVEASGLHEGSYPIGVGFCLPWSQGAPFSRLIRPHSSWTQELWCSDAECMHKITRAECIADGRSVLEVATWMNAQLEGQIVLVDTIQHDSDWVAALFDAAGVRCQFRVEWMMPFFDELLAEKIALADERWAFFEYIRDLSEERHPHAHRAASNSAKLACIYELIVGPEVAGLLDDFRETISD